MKFTARLTTVVMVVAFCGTLHASTYGSVEPIANPAVIDTQVLREQPLRVREAFAQGLLQCGIVSRVTDTLTSTGAISTINDLNTRVAVGAGGFAGETNPSYVYNIIDDGPNGASQSDIRILTDALGYVLSQASAFLLDADDPTSYDFGANYVVLNFPAPPPIARSAALFRTVGRIDPELFSTESSGYTQFGRAYLSLQSFVPEEQFISGYFRAAAEFGVEYTPVVNGQPSLFQGGAAFPGNDWMANPGGEEYLARIPAASHRGLARIRAFHLRVTEEVIRRLEKKNGAWHGGAAGFDCR